MPRRQARKGQYTEQRFSEMLILVFTRYRARSIHRVYSRRQAPGQGMVDASIEMSGFGSSFSVTGAGLPEYVDIWHLCPSMPLLGGLAAVQCGWCLTCQALNARRLRLYCHESKPGPARTSGTKVVVELADWLKALKNVGQADLAVAAIY